MSYTVLYILVMLLSFLLMNSWIILARFIQQIKLAPSDSDFDKLTGEKMGLEKVIDDKTNEILELKARVEELSEKLATSPPSKAS